jgi:hypothetical protein
VVVSQDRHATLRAAGERALRLVQRPQIGARWTPGPIERRDSCAGTFEQINAREQSLDADLIQRALLCPLPPRGNGRIRSWLLAGALFGALAAVAFFGGST